MRHVSRIAVLLILGFAATVIGSTTAAAQSETITTAFRLQSANESICRGTHTLTVTATEAISRTQIDCNVSPYRLESLEAASLVYPQGNPDFDFERSGCIDCDYAQAIKRMPVQSGQTYCGGGSAAGSTNINRPWAGGVRVDRCLRAP